MVTPFSDSTHMCSQKMVGIDAYNPTFLWHLKSAARTQSWYTLTASAAGQMVNLCHPLGNPFCQRAAVFGIWDLNVACSNPQKHRKVTSISKGGLCSIFLRVAKHGYVPYWSWNIVFYYSMMEHIIHIIYSNI